MKSFKNHFSKPVELDEAMTSADMSDVQRENVSDIEYTARNHLDSDKVKVKKAGKDTHIHVSSYHDHRDLVKHINQLHKKNYKVKAVDNTPNGKRITVSESVNEEVLDEAMTSAVMIDDFFSMSDDQREKLVKLAKKHNLQTPIEKRGRKNVAVVDGDKKTMQKFEKELKRMGINFTATESVELGEMEGTQLDELKKSTLGSYVNKAAKDAASKAYGAASAAKDNRADQSGKDFSKSLKRLRGIDTATKKLAKEDIDEAKDFDQKFKDHLKFATSDNPVVKNYMAKKVDQRRARNAKMDPGADKKGLAISVTDRQKAYQKAKKKGIGVMDIDTSLRNRGKRRLPEEVELIEGLDQEKFQSAEARLIKYAQKNGGIDKRDFMEVAKMLGQIGRINILQAGQVLARLNRKLSSMDTDPRDKVYEILKSVKLMEGTNPPFTPDPKKQQTKNSDGTETSPMSRAKQLAKMARDRKMKKEELDQETIDQVTAQYINENNITLEELENMTEEELNELIGKAIGGAFKLGAKAAVGTARAAGNVARRFTVAGRADAAEKRASELEKKNKDRQRIRDAQQRVRDAKKAARNNK